MPRASGTENQVRVKGPVGLALPLLVVANHPLGCLEGMLLTRELLRHRPDTKVLANELLLRFPEFNELFIFGRRMGHKYLSGDRMPRGDCLLKIKTLNHCFYI